MGYLREPLRLLEWTYCSPSQDPVTRVLLFAELIVSLRTFTGDKADKVLLDVRTALVLVRPQPMTGDLDTKKKDS